MNPSAWNLRIISPTWTPTSWAVLKLNGPIIWMSLCRGSPLTISSSRYKQSASWKVPYSSHTFPYFRSVKCFRAYFSFLTCSMAFASFMTADLLIACIEVLVLCTP